jgi:RHS repeat-associated protein
LGSSSLITNLDGEIVQHVEYVPFGEVFIEERNNTWNTPYLFNAKELDEETGLYYYGARYYDARVSLWLSTDPIATYNPFEKENFIDGQHNGGVYNSFNHGVYTYCYQNPVKLVDPNGKQSSFMDLGYSMMGSNPHATAMKSEAQKLEVHAAKPAAIGISVGAVGLLAPIIPVAGVFGVAFDVNLITKGPEAGTVGIYFTLQGGAGLPNISGSGGVSVGMTHIKGDERLFMTKSMAGSSEKTEVGYKAVSVSQTTTIFEGGVAETNSIGLSKGKSMFPLSATKTGQQSLLLGTFKLYNNNNEGYDPNESAKDYYIRKYTNLNQLKNVLGATD